MAKWDSEKLTKEMEQAENDGKPPPVPVPTPISYEESRRRYEKG